ncbi:pirin family protein [Candidatus Gracilibacteria bacterium]|nr:pirin family protein [Candidatus Gracilibacteria bacterium]NJM89255.1 pirin family protein [Hydrococcus sp. RU_2_2]NJP21064.1 pirin family protein [Hydrococcus sp. CRU_1_1]NJQ96584.1 pirin family protein [Hydrococcus sp. CSU_1_8]
MSQNTKSHLIHDRNIRGHSQIGWLDSYHTFSFGSFQDPDRMGFRHLRVINEDRVVPGAGFATHSHRDMEIISYVLEGALEHKDSLGNGTIIKPGEVQIMSAGTGITHSEFNPSETEAVHFLQIWIIPDEKNLSPRYEQQYFSPEERQSKLRLVVSPDGREGSVTIHQDVYLYASLLKPDNTLTYQIPSSRYGWVQIAQGVATLNGQELRAGDGVQINGEEKLEISTNVGAEVLLFDLA